MQHRETREKGPRTFALKLEPGEQVIATMKAFAASEDVSGAFFTGIGAIRDVTLAWFDTASKKYINGSFEGPLELLALTGNFARGPGGEIVAHCHALCSGRDLKAVGGHLVEATVAVTIELGIFEAGFPLDRALDPEFGLNLMSL